MSNRIIRDRSRHHSATPGHQASKELLPHIAWPPADDVYWQKITIATRLGRYHEVQDWLTRIVTGRRLSEKLFRASVLKDEDYFWDLQDSTHHDHALQKFLPPTLGWMLEHPEFFAMIKMDHEAFLRYMLMKRRTKYWETWHRLAEQMMVNPRVFNIVPLERRWKLFEEFAWKFYYRLPTLNWKLLGIDPAKIRQLWWDLLNRAPNHNHELDRALANVVDFESVPSYIKWMTVWPLFGQDELIRILKAAIVKDDRNFDGLQKNLAHYLAFTVNQSDFLKEAILDERILLKARYVGLEIRDTDEEIATRYWVRERAINRALPVATALLAAG